MKIASSNIISIADENKMKINPITLDDEKRMNFHSSENLDISQLELLLQHNSTKHYKLIQNTSSNSTVLNTMSPVGEVHLVAVQKDNSGIQHLIRILQGEETLNHTVNLVSQFSQKLHKHIKRLEVNKSVLHRKLFNNSGLETHKQIVLAEKCMLDIVRTLHINPLCRDTLDPRKCFMSFENEPTYQSYKSSRNNRRMQVLRTIKTSYQCTTETATPENLRPVKRTRRHHGN